MNKFYLVFLLFVFQGSVAQSERSLDETKAYIIKLMNDHAFREHSHTKRLRATFEEDLLRVHVLNKNGETTDDGLVYNFANTYKYNGPKRLPGDIAHLTIWLDYLPYKSSKKWQKTDFEFDVNNYEAAEQLMTAFRHLN